MTDPKSSGGEPAPLMEVNRSYVELALPEAEATGKRQLAAILRSWLEVQEDASALLTANRDHRARVEELEAQARELNRGMAMLCSAMERRSYEQIRTTFGGNTPELWCATADELCGLLTRVEELERERDEAREAAEDLRAHLQGSANRERTLMEERDEAREQLGVARGALDAAMRGCGGAITVINNAHVPSSKLLCLLSSLEPDARRGHDLAAEALAKLQAGEEGSDG